MSSGSTRLVALLGQPVAESLSPRMQNAAFAARGLDWAYAACDVAPELLEEAVRGLVALGFAGANVTSPHKQAAAASSVPNVLRCHRITRASMSTMSHQLAASRGLPQTAPGLAMQAPVASQS